MLEIVLLIMMSRKLGARVEKKGHSKLPYQLLLWGLWFGGEIGGALFGAFTGSMAVRGDEPTFYIYLCALAGAGVGAVIAHVIADSLKPVDRMELRQPDVLDGASERFGDRGKAAQPLDERITQPADDRIQQGE